MSQRVYKEDNNTKDIIVESKMVEEALKKAFLDSGGNAFGEVRLLGVINGTQGFLCGVFADLFSLSKDEHKELLVKSVSVFVKHLGYESVAIYGEMGPAAAMVPLSRW